MPIKVFYVVPVTPATKRVWLRRYTHDKSCPAMPGDLSYHDARTLLGDFPGQEDINTVHDDPRWPTQCACGYTFGDADEWQIFPRALYARYDGQPGTWTLLDDDLPPGGMWNASWRPRSLGKGDDGISLVVRLPNRRDWCVDGRASNCTMPNDNVHRCWVRHGDPRTGDVHVDKNGVTCQAGAGSILSGDYHGFLHHGYLTD